MRAPPPPMASTPHPLRNREGPSFWTPGGRDRRARNLSRSTTRTFPDFSYPRFPVFFPSIFLANFGVVDMRRKSLWLRRKCVRRKCS